MHELTLLADGKAARWLVLFFEPSAGVIISYRLDRCGYLLFGSNWTAMRILFFPVILFLGLWSCRHEICWKAEVGKGLRIIHPTLGVVMHAEAIVGENCVLLGGNIIGGRKSIRRGELVVGNNVVLGVHACVLGPVKVGNRVQIGAGAVVVHDLADDAVAVGIPARPISERRVSA
ncbi:MAG: serine acetyltransferase [Verrucomicrobia bacterium]|nr:serine acetyltransferase [Verrucomicrobiota bacterium]